MVETFPIRSAIFHWTDHPVLSLLLRQVLLQGHVLLHFVQFLWLLLLQMLLFKLQEGTTQS